MKVFSGFKRERLDISLKIYLLTRLLLWVETFLYWCFQVTTILNLFGKEYIPFGIEADEASREVCYFGGILYSLLWLSRLFSSSCYAQLQ